MNVTCVPSCAYNRVMIKVKFKVQSNYAYIHSRKVVRGALNRHFQNVLLWTKFDQKPSAVNFVQNQLCRYYYFNNKELGTFGWTEVSLIQRKRSVIVLEYFVIPTYCVMIDYIWFLLVFQTIRFFQIKFCDMDYWFKNRYVCFALLLPISSVFNVHPRRSDKLLVKHYIHIKVFTSFWNW